MMIYRNKNFDYKPSKILRNSEPGNCLTRHKPGNLGTTISNITHTPNNKDYNSQLVFHQQIIYLTGIKI